MSGTSQRSMGGSPLLPPLMMDNLSSHRPKFQRDTRRSVALELFPHVLPCSRQDISTETPCVVFQAIPPTVWRQRAVLLAQMDKSIQEKESFCMQPISEVPTTMFIAVIDDFPTVCKILETCLSREGYVAKSFHDPVLAFRAFCLWIFCSKTRGLTGMR